MVVVWGFFLRLFKRVVDQHTVEVGELGGTGLWRWLLAVGRLHFKGSTSLTLPWHFQKKNLSVTIRIGHGDTLRGFKFVRKDQRGTRVVLMELLFSPDHHTSKKVYLLYTADSLKVKWYKGTPCRGLEARIKLGDPTSIFWTPLFYPHNQVSKKVSFMVVQEVVKGVLPIVFTWLVGNFLLWSIFPTSQSFRIHRDNLTVTKD